MSDDKNKQLFYSLIYSFQMQTMMQLGKLANPVTGTIEKELDHAQMTIDMLDMLKEKTKGNTSEDEIKLITQVIADLKLNYVEERDKEITTSDSNDKPAEKSSDQTGTEKAEEVKEERSDELK